jgi:hypothetical protein
MSVPNINALKQELKVLAEELKSETPIPLTGLIEEKWMQGYMSGQWDAGYHIEQIIKDFFD